MAAADIDGFIRNQKQKIASERQGMRAKARDSQGVAGAMVNSQYPVTRNDPVANQVPPHKAQFSPREVEDQVPVLTYKQTDNSDDPLVEKLGALERQRQEQLLNQMQQRYAGQGPQHPPEVQNGNYSNNNHVERESQFGDKLGEYEKKRRQLDETRKQEYQALLEADRQRRRGRSRQPDNSDENADAATLLGIRDSSSAKKRKEVERNQEYNDYLRQRGQSIETKPPGNAANSVPVSSPPSGMIGVRDSRAEKLKKEQIRNQEYNEFLRQRQMEKSRGGVRERDMDVRTEGAKSVPPPNNYRGAPAPVAREATMPAQAPIHAEMKEFDNTLDELERRVAELRSYDISKDPKIEQYRQGPYPPSQSHNPGVPRIAIPQNISPVHLSPRGGIPPDAAPEHNSIQKLRNHDSAEARKRAERNREYNNFLANKNELDLTRRDWKREGADIHYEDILTQKRFEEGLYRRHYDDPELYYNLYNRRGPVIAAPLLDPKLTAEEQRLNDMEAKYDSSKMKMLFKKPNSPRKTGGRNILQDDHWMRSGGNTDKVFDLDMSLTRNRFPGRGGADVDSGGIDIRRPDSAALKERKKEVYKKELQRQMQEEEDRRRREKANLRSEKPGVLGGTTSAAQVPSQSLLTGGNILKPELLAQAGGLPQLSPYNTPADDAYFYYGMKNPLDTTDGGGSGTFGAYEPTATGSQRTGRVRFQDNEPAASGMVFTSEEERKSKLANQKQEYARELQRQMNDSRVQQEARRRHLDELDKLKEQEIALYDPFGRGGGGAPLKDDQGNVRTNLKEAIADIQSGRTPRQRGYSNNAGDVSNDIRDLQLRLSKSFNTGGLGGSGGRTTSPPLPWIDNPSPRQTNALGEPTHARGGHGIFGQALSEDQKNNRDKYQTDLRIQMEERKRQKEMEKAREREEEEKEQKRLEEQQRRIQAELAEEKRKQQEKDEDARRKNDELKRAADERKKIVENQRTARQEKDRVEKVADEAMFNRGPSPPVPAVRTKMESEPQPQIATFRQPETYNRNDVSYTAEPESLSQLAHLRSQLQSERRRVEMALELQRTQPEVFDPRLQGFQSNGDSRPLQGPTVGHQVDVFELASEKRRPVAVHRNNATSRRGGEQANPDAVQEFARLRHRQNDPAAARVREAFPETPQTVNGLETQQVALLREQTRSPNNNRDFNFGMTPRDLGLRPYTRDSVQLDSESAFVEIDQPGTTRWDAYGGDHSGYGSQVSLDVDRIARQNEARLNKLQRLQADAISLNDPEEVLSRFMSKQQRPMSGETLRDDSWMRPL